ncbi:MAG: hypothetical protein LCH63_10500 [Candidatus Melainabacteria bacterium]|nr:hypothetical protein [Candidatus Melainabacteria bacterium]
MEKAQEMNGRPKRSIILIAAAGLIVICTVESVLAYFAFLPIITKSLRSISEKKAKAQEVHQ